MSPCDVPLWCHKSLQTRSSTQSIPLALFPSLLYPTSSINCFVFETQNIWNCPPFPTLLLADHLPTALSLILTSIYIFIHSFVYLFSLYIKIIYMFLYVLHLIPNELQSSPQSIPPPSKDSSTCTLLSLHTITATTTTTTISSVENGPWGLLPDLICQPIHQNCKQERDQSRSLMQSYNYLETLRRTNTWHLFCVSLP